MNNAALPRSAFSLKLDRRVPIYLNYTNVMDDRYRSFIILIAGINNARHHVLLSRLGVVACACNPATWKSEVLDCVSSGALRVVVLWRSSVHAKFRINRVDRTEVWSSWLSKEGRTGPGRKRSRQKVPVRNSSGIALVNSRRSAAQTIQ